MATEPMTPTSADGLHDHTERVVSEILAESGSWKEAVERVLALLCKALGWEMSEFWRCTGTKMVLNVAYISNESYRPMVENQLAFYRGVGLPGRAWEAGTSIWSSELWADCGFQRSAIATSLDLTTGLAVPVLLDNELLGVVTLFSSQHLEPDPDLHEMVERVGIQLAAKVVE